MSLATNTVIKKDYTLICCLYKQIFYFFFSQLFYNIVDVIFTETIFNSKKVVNGNLRLKGKKILCFVDSSKFFKHSESNSNPLLIFLYYV